MVAVVNTKAEEHLHDTKAVVEVAEAHLIETWKKKNIHSIDMNSWRTPSLSTLPPSWTHAIGDIFYKSYIKFSGRKNVHNQTNMYGNVTNMFKTTGHSYKRETTSLPFSGHFLGITCYDINLVAQLD